MRTGKGCNRCCLSCEFFDECIEDFENEIDSEIPSPPLRSSAWLLTYKTKALLLTAFGILLCIVLLTRVSSRRDRRQRA